jgi:DnaJ-class molecular chaperone
MPYCKTCQRTARKGARKCSKCGNLLYYTEEEIRDLDEEESASMLKQVVKEVSRTCAFCKGTGRIPGPLGMVVHQLCNGTGRNWLPESWPKCNRCKGTGKMSYGGGIARIEPSCPKCEGRGWSPE